MAWQEIDPTEIAPGAPITQELLQKMDFRDKAMLEGPAAGRWDDYSVDAPTGAVKFLTLYVPRGVSTVWFECIVGIADPGTDPKGRIYLRDPETEARAYGEFTSFVGLPTADPENEEDTFHFGRVAFPPVRTDLATGGAALRGKIVEAWFEITDSAEATGTFHINNKAVSDIDLTAELKLYTRQTGFGVRFGGPVRGGDVTPAGDLLLHTTGSTRAAIVQIVQSDESDFISRGIGFYKQIGLDVGTTFDLTHLFWARAPRFAANGPGWLAVWIVRYHYDESGEYYEYWNEDTSSWEAGTLTSGHAVKVLLPEAGPWQELSVAFSTDVPDDTYDLWSYVTGWGSGNAALIGQPLFLDDMDLRLTDSPFTSFMTHGGFDKDIVEIHGSISEAVNATPVVVDLAEGYLLVDGDPVEASGFEGLTAANGDFAVTVIETDNFHTRFSLDGSVGNAEVTFIGTFITPYGSNIVTGEDISYALNIKRGVWRFVWEGQVGADEI